MVYAWNIVHMKDMILVCCGGKDWRAHYSVNYSGMVHCCLLVTWCNKFGITRFVCWRGVLVNGIVQSWPGPNTPWKLLVQGELSGFSSELQGTQALFGCSRIHINPHVLRWIGVKFELNSTPIHTNTHGLKWIRQHPNKALGFRERWKEYIYFFCEYCVDTGANLSCSCFIIYFRLWFYFLNVFYLFQWFQLGTRIMVLMGRVCQLWFHVI